MDDQHDLDGDESSFPCDSCGEPVHEEDIHEPSGEYVCPSCGYFSGSY